MRRDDLGRRSLPPILLGTHYLVFLKSPHIVRRLGLDSPHSSVEMKKYIHQLKAWPQFNWDPVRLAERLAFVHYEQGRLLGGMEHLGFQSQQEALLISLSLSPYS